MGGQTPWGAGGGLAQPRARRRTPRRGVVVVKGGAGKIRSGSAQTAVGTGGASSTLAGRAHQGPRGGRSGKGVWEGGGWDEGQAD